MNLKKINKISPSIMSRTILHTHTNYWSHCFLSRIEFTTSNQFNSIQYSSPGYGCAGVSSVAYGLIAREVERFDMQ